MTTKVHERREATLKAVALIVCPGLLTGWGWDHEWGHGLLTAMTLLAAFSAVTGLTWLMTAGDCA